jgi:hypothetical protein
LFCQSVFGRLAGYEDVNDADRLAHDPAMRAVVGRGGLDRRTASTSQMGRFETGRLASEANLTALTDLSGCLPRDIAIAKRSVRWLSCLNSGDGGPSSGESRIRAFSMRIGALKILSLFVLASNSI